MVYTTIIILLVCMQALMQWQWPALREPHHCLTAAATGTLLVTSYAQNDDANILLAISSFAFGFARAKMHDCHTGDSVPRAQPSNCLSDSNDI